MQKINQDKARMLTDTVQSYDSLMLSVVLGKEFGSATLAALGA